MITSLITELQGTEGQDPEDAETNLLTIVE